MINEETLVGKMVEDLIEPLKQYRIAKRAVEGFSGRKVLEIPPQSPCDYWNNIIRAKISVINCVGGFELASKICNELMNHPEDAEYQLSGGFEYLAEGIIGGWYS